MFTLSAFTQFLDSYRTGRARARTRRVIGDLPPELLCDIGWPEHYRPQTSTTRR